MTELNEVAVPDSTACIFVVDKVFRQYLPHIVRVVVRIAGDLLPLAGDAAIVVAKRVFLRVAM